LGDQSLLGGWDMTEPRTAKLQPHWGS